MKNMNLKMEDYTPKQQEEIADMVVSFLVYRITKRNSRDEPLINKLKQIYEEKVPLEIRNKIESKGKSLADFFTQ